MNQLAIRDHSREGLTAEKFFQPFRLLSPQNTHAIAKVSAFQKISISKINELLGIDIRGVILDIDECVAPHHGEILPENIAAITAMIQEGISMVIYSNMESTDRYNPLIEAVRNETGYLIKVMTNIPAKPHPAGFQACAEELELPPENIAMIGDNFLTDGGAIRSGMKFIKVKPIASPKTSGKRLIQKSFRTLAEKLSDLHDKITKRPVLTDDHLESGAFADPDALRNVG